MASLLVDWARMHLTRGISIVNPNSIEFFRLQRIPFERVYERLSAIRSNDLVDWLPKVPKCFARRHLSECMARALGFELPGPLRLPLARLLPSLL
jgi:hypothetical protein